MPSGFPGYIPANSDLILYVSPACTFSQYISVTNKSSSDVELQKITDEQK